MTKDLPAALLAALAELARTPRLLVALDFDGTLAPHVDSPDRARALPEAREAVRALLALPETPVAVVSGRALESLALVTDFPDEVLYVGSHGLEYRLGGPVVDLALDAAERDRLHRLDEQLREISQRFPGTWIERKPAGLVLHTRLMDSPGRAAEAQQEALERGAVDGVTATPGKNVLEFSVRAADKGQGVTRLREHTGADAVIYVGDDVTDEHAFAVLGSGDLGLKSGPGETTALFRVDGPPEVAVALARLAQLRARALG